MSDKLRSSSVIQRTSRLEVREVQHPLVDIIKNMLKVCNKNQEMEKKKKLSQYSMYL